MKQNMDPKTKNLSQDSARISDEVSVKVSKSQDLADASAPAGAAANGAREKTVPEQVAAAADKSTAPKPQEGVDEVIIIFFIFIEY